MSKIDQKEGLPFETEKKGNTIKRLFHCECGQPLCEQNLTTGELKFLFHRGGKDSFIKVKPIGPGGGLEILCTNPDCHKSQADKRTLSHKIMFFQEKIDSSDQFRV
jgi:hypothetical protein